MFPGTQRFAVVSKRLLFYDLFHVQTTEDKSLKDKNLRPSDNMKALKPGKTTQQKQQLVGVDFNSMTGDFVVVTSNEIRQYSGSTGQIIKILSDINDPRSKAEIKSFAFDNRGKKVILGDAEGTVWQINL